MSSTVKIIRPAGILNNTGATQMRLEIDSELKLGAKTILVDLENVSFIDSSGLGIFALTVKAMREAGGQMYLCSVNEQPRLLFELTGMERIFEIFPNQAAFQRAISVSASVENTRFKVLETNPQ